MTQQDTLNKAIEYLKYQGLVSSKTDLAEQMGANRVSVSRACSGDPSYLTADFLQRLNTTFGSIFSASWLLTGEGSMLKEKREETEEIIHVDNAEDYNKAVSSGLSLVPEREVFFRGGNAGETNDIAPIVAYWHIPGVHKQAEIVTIDGDSMHPVSPAGSKVVLVPLPFDPSEPTSIPFGSIFGIAVEDTATGEYACYIKYLRRHRDPEMANRYWIARSANSEQYDDFDIAIDKVRHLWLVDTSIKRLR